MGFKILAINPGSTSTKVALYDEERPLLDLTLRHSAEQIAHYPNIIDQLDWRRDMILTALKEHGFDIMSLAAVIGRGGLIKPIPAGVYEVNDAMRRDLQHATMEHASNLGGLLADGIAATAGIKAYIADPVVVDEMDDIARLSGHPDCPRRSIFHALNQKATARLHCDRIGIVYEKATLVVAPLGGGISGDFPICVVPMMYQDLEWEETPCWAYFCQISDSTTSYGSYSGAVPNEKITWGKLLPDTPSFIVESDATIVAPLIFAYVLGQ